MGIRNSELDKEENWEQIYDNKFQIQMICQVQGIQYNMFGYRQSRPCRNGPTCYYKRQGTCWFYHPPSHQNTSLLYNLGPRSMVFQHRPQTSNFDSEIIARNRTARQQSLSDILMKLGLKWGMKKEVIEEIIEQKDEQPKYITLNGKQVQLVPVKSGIGKQKQWFFDRSQHFNFFTQCGLDQCSICITNFGKQQLLSTLFCNHTFHHQCIKQWLMASSQCPLCRKDFRGHEQFKKMKGYVKPSILRAPKTVLSYNGITVSDNSDNEWEGGLANFNASISVSEEEQDIYSEDYSYGFDDEYDDYEFQL